MIRNRPKAHLSERHYRGLPPAPYAVNFDNIPETVKLSLFPLRHVEPMTAEVAEMIGEIVEDYPTKEELEHYKQENAVFQHVFIVVNSIFDKIVEDVSYLIPYSISLIPASKRGYVEHSNTDFVEAMANSEFLKGGAAYLGLDPFIGEWGLWSDVGLIAEIGASSAFTDEMGLVYDYYFLRKEVNRQDIIQPAIDMPPDRIRNYLRHRSRLLYTPFEQFKSRPIWGLENGLELFLFQEFKRQSTPNPVLQSLIFKDGSWFPALYNSWQAFAQDDDFVSSADFYFPESKLAVFCDGGTHRRGKKKVRDEEISNKLHKAGIKSIRLSSKEILRDVQSAVSKVRENL
jgi:hypothetical protein